MSHYDNEREADEKPDWSKAPNGATHYGDGRYWMNSSFGFVSVWSWHDKFSNRWKASNESPVGHHDFTLIPQTRTKPHQIEPVPLKPQNSYQRTIIGLDGSKCVVDVYRVLDAFKTDSPALDHAIKKILCPGTRHAKTREQDLKEAIKSIEAELLLMSQR